MSQYARIENGIVVEVIEPTEPIASLYNAAFVETLVESDGTAGVAPGWTYAAGVFAAPPVPAPPTAQELLMASAAALIAGGITITSTGTVALDGVYDTNAAAQNNLQAVQIYIQANGKFPGSSGTYPWLDKTGAPHLFPSVTEFTAFATAIADFVADCTLIVLTGAGTLPAASATIP